MGYVVGTKDTLIHDWVATTTVVIMNQPIVKVCWATTKISIVRIKLVIEIVIDVT